MENSTQAVNAETYSRYFGPEPSAGDVYAPSNSGDAVQGQEAGARIGVIAFDDFPNFDSSNTTFVGTISVGTGGLGGTLDRFLPDFANLATRSLPAMFHFVVFGNEVEVTVPDAPGAIASDVPTKVYELRRLTGLSWEQLSSVLGVSRRTLHNWATGRDVAAKNEERLARILATVHYIDRGNAAENRSLLLSATSGGDTLFDLLCHGHHEEVRKIAGRGAGRVERRMRPLDEKARQQLAPERFGEALERASAVPDLAVPEGDGIVRKSGVPKKVKRLTRARTS